MRNRRNAAGAIGVVGVALLLALSGAAAARAQNIVEQAPSAEEAHPAPDLDEAASILLDAPYLTDAERSALRIKHGVWTESDLSTPALRAKAMLLSGAYKAAVFDDASVPALDRAEAHLRRGEPDKALSLVGDDTTARAAAIAGEALVHLGRTEDAVTRLERCAGVIRDQKTTDAAEVAAAANGLVILARLRGAEGSDVIGYQEILGLLGHARDVLDRLSPEVLLAEAALLYEKDAYEQAGPALESALAMNPRSARAWYLLGRLSAESFDFPRAEAIALKLDELASPGPGLEGGLVRALVRMRQNEGQAARDVLDPLVEQFPGSREALALRVASAALAFDDAGAKDLMAQFETIAPGSPAPYVEAGKALASARQYEDAAAMLRTASELAPLWAEPLVELGLSELQAGRLREARAALDKGLLLDRFHVRARNSLTLLKEIEAYTTVESDHFVVRFKPGQDEVLAREMLPVLERIFTRVTGDGPGGIRMAPPEKTVVELYPNHRWFSTRITGLPKLHTFAAATGPVIAMEAPRDGAGHLVGPYDWARVVQHEYTHTVTLARTKNRLPHWFTEASAVYLEDAPRDWPTVQILTGMMKTGSIFDFETINVMFVRPKRPQDRSQAYQQGAWMYEYMIERFGEETPLKLMDLYASGVREPEAFQRTMSVTREQFLEDFSKWANEQLQSWGMAPTEDHKSLDALVEEAKADAATPELLERWRGDHPGNPFVLEQLVKRAEKREGGLTLDDATLLLDYAKARPVDPRPHTLMVKLLTSPAAASLSEEERAERIAPHLEYLDAREQHAPGLAADLARRYETLGNAGKAVEKAARATRVAPYDANLRELAATVALRAGDRAEAERHILALTILEPDREVHKKRLEALRAMPK